MIIKNLQKMFSKDNANQGITFIELIISMVIFGLVISVVAKYFSNEAATSEQYIHATRLRQNIRTAMDLIMRDVKVAGYNPQGIGGNWIFTNNNALKIHADLNGDGDINDENEQIKYWYESDNKELKRMVLTGGQTDVVLEDITTFEFQGRDLNDNITSAPPHIKKIYVKLAGRTRTRQRTPDTQDGYRVFSMESQAILRNL